MLHIAITLILISKIMLKTGNSKDCALVAAVICTAIHISSGWKASLVIFIVTYLGGRLYYPKIYQYDGIASFIFATMLGALLIAATAQIATSIL